MIVNSKTLAASQTVVIKMIDKTNSVFNSVLVPYNSKHAPNAPIHQNESYALGNVDCASELRYLVDTRAFIKSQVFFPVKSPKYGLSKKVDKRRFKTFGKA